MRGPHLVISLIAVLGLAACSQGGRDISMRALDKPNEGPDEFSILPSNRLQAPANYANLPTPTPGGRNLTDRDPRAEGIVALGGTPQPASATSVPATDAGLVSFARRNGGIANIRESLATEDEAFRRRQSRFTKIRLIKTDRYAEAYARETLDAYASWNRFRRAGLRTPAAPPANE